MTIKNLNVTKRNKRNKRNIWPESVAFFKLKMGVWRLDVTLGFKLCNRQRNTL